MVGSRSSRSSLPARPRGFSPERNTLHGCKKRTTLFGGPRLRGPGGLPEKASFVVASLWRLSATAAEHLGENRASRGIFGRSPGAPFDTIGTTGRFILRPHCIGGRTDLWAAACPATDEWNRF